MSEEFRLRAKPVNFEATDVKLYLDLESQPQLSYGVQLARIYPHLSARESITLSTEETFEDLNGHINVFAETDELKNNNDRKGIGYITYVRAFDDRYGLNSTPACYDVRVLVPKVMFDELLTTARLSRLPSNISIYVEGMELDWQPDGSGQKWDNKAFPRLNVTAISFGVPLIAQVTNSKFDQHPCDNVSPPTRAQFDDLSQKLDLLTRGLGSLFWVVILIGVVIGVRILLVR